MDFTFHPGVNGSSPWVEFYPYNPSLTAGYAFMAIFGLATLAHIVLMFPYKAAYFIPFVLGGICTSQTLPFLPSLYHNTKESNSNNEYQAKHSATTAAHAPTTPGRESGPGLNSRCCSSAHHHS